jgi:hypothetical protein
MSWLKRLLGGSAKPTPLTPPAAAVRVSMPVHSRRIVSIPEVDFVGERVSSPNQRYMLLWHDRRWIDGEVFEGRYLLIDRDAVVLDAKMERPQDGKVADDGTFILNDWGASVELSGTFHAFRRDGSGIVSRLFSANLLNNGLSRDGRLAACQTCNAPGSPDSSVLCVFDLERGAEFASWVPESGWAKGYDFPGGERIRMLRGDRPPLDYSLTGEFLDRRSWIEDEVRRGTLYVIRKALAEGATATGLTHDDLRLGARRALTDGDERFKAEAWRLLGEVEESVADIGRALEAYDRALAVNPKVGVAKRAAALRKAKRSG